MQKVEGSSPFIRFANRTGRAQILGRVSRRRASRGNAIVC